MLRNYYMRVFERKSNFKIILHGATELRRILNHHKNLKQLIVITCNNLNLNLIN